MVQLLGLGEAELCTHCAAQAPKRQMKAGAQHLAFHQGPPVLNVREASVRHRAAVPNASMKGSWKCAGQLAQHFMKPFVVITS